MTMRVSWKLDAGESVLWLNRRLRRETSSCFFGASFDISDRVLDVHGFQASKHHPSVA